MDCSSYNFCLSSIPSLFWFLRGILLPLHLVLEGLSFIVPHASCTQDGYLTQSRQLEHYIPLARDGTAQKSSSEEWSQIKTSKVEQWERWGVGEGGERDAHTNTQPWMYFLRPWFQLCGFISQQMFFLKLRESKLITCNQKSPDKYTVFSSKFFALSLFSSLITFVPSVDP